MTRFTSSLICLVIAFLIQRPNAGRSNVEIQSLAAEQEAIVDWAIGRFAEADLELPPLRIVGSSDRAACRERDGIALDRGDHSEVRLCTTDADSRIEFLVLHELAHAWDHGNNDLDRLAFLRLRGLEAWRGADVEWHEAGAEHLAEIMMWGLMDRPIRVVRIHDTSCEQLHVAYLALTGRGPSSGVHGPCGIQGA